MKPSVRPAVESAVARVKRDLADHGRARIIDFLAHDYARHLLAEASTADYHVVTTRETGHLDMPTAWLNSLNTAQRQGLGQVIQTTATTRFQYLFDNYPIYDLAQIDKGEAVWRDLVAFLNGEDFLGLMRRVTGEPGIAMADAQLTRYRPGHFLTRHDDHLEGKNRYFAYVLSLSPVWLADWGGLLAFHGANEDVEATFTPRFNTLSLFRTPQLHSVTQVALFAGADRISVTGWLRGL